MCLTGTQVWLAVNHNTSVTSGVGSLNGYFENVNINPMTMIFIIIDSQAEWKTSV